MSIFERMKASIGVGAAKVDARLHNHNVEPGEEITGEVFILGGSVSQEVSGVYLNVKTKVLKETNDKVSYFDYTYFKFLAASNFTVSPKEEITIPFSFKLPLQSPISSGNTQIWIQTELDIPLAIDPSDKDSIIVNPNESTKIVLEAINSLGFTLRKVENIHSYKSPIGVLQEFEYFVREGEFRGYLDELELVIIPETFGVKLLIEVDRKVRGLGSLFAEALDLDERKITLSLDNGILKNGVQTVSERIRNVIQAYI